MTGESLVQRRLVIDLRVDAFPAHEIVGDGGVEVAQRHMRVFFRNRLNGHPIAVHRRDMADPDARAREMHGWPPWTPGVEVIRVPTSIGVSPVMRVSPVE